MTLTLSSLDPQMTLAFPTIFSGIQECKGKKIVLRLFWAFDLQPIILGFQLDLDYGDPLKLFVQIVQQLQP